MAGTPQLERVADPTARRPLRRRAPVGRHSHERVRRRRARRPPAAGLLLALGPAACGAVRRRRHAVASQRCRTSGSTSRSAPSSPASSYLSQALNAVLLLATHASLALAHARTAELAGLRQAQLHRAIDTHDIIGQAKGILMNRQGITAEEAFDLLSEASQHLNVGLLDLATDLATRHNELDRLVSPPWAPREPG